MADRNRFSNSKKRASQNNTTNQNKIEQTTRIRVDQERLEDFNSLDTSFLEGRLEKKFKNNKKLRKKLFQDSINKHLSFVFFKIVLLVVSVFCIIALLFFGLSPFFSKPKVEVKKESSVSSKIEKKHIDDNYLFVGDFHTKDLSLDDFSYPSVKVSENDYKTSDILDHMRDRIYQYNPSSVIIELGINDLSDKVSSEDFLSNLESIILGIQDNRPYASIYIESIYPINTDNSDYDDDYLGSHVSVEDINSLNEQIEDLAKNTDVSYINTYEVLIDKGHLNDKYTDDGIHLNDDGYRQVLKKISEVVGDSS